MGRLRRHHPVPPALPRGAGARLDGALGGHRGDVLRGHAALLVAARLAERHHRAQAGDDRRSRRLHGGAAALHDHDRPLLVHPVPPARGHRDGGLRPGGPVVRGRHHQRAQPEQGLRVPDDGAVRRADRRTRPRGAALRVRRRRDGRLLRDLLLRRDPLRGRAGRHRVPRTRAGGAEVAAHAAPPRARGAARDGARRSSSTGRSSRRPSSPSSSSPSPVTTRWARGTWCGACTSPTSAPPRRTSA